MDPGPHVHGVGHTRPPMTPRLKREFWFALDSPLGGLEPQREGTVLWNPLKSYRGRDPTESGAVECPTHLWSRTPSNSRRVRLSTCTPVEDATDGGKGRETDSAHLPECHYMDTRPRGEYGTPVEYSTFRRHTEKESLDERRKVS